MRLTPLNKVTFWIPLFLVGLGIAGNFLTLGIVSGWSWVLVVGGCIIRMLGLLLKGF